MKKFIRVTANAIREGRRSDLPPSLSCPVQRGIRRVFRWHRVRVDSHWCYIDGIRVELPKTALIFINRFDRGLSVRPFSFLLSF